MCQIWWTFVDSFKVNKNIWLSFSEHSVTVQTPKWPSLSDSAFSKPLDSKSVKLSDLHVKRNKEMSQCFIHPFPQKSQVSGFIFTKCLMGSTRRHLQLCQILAIDWRFHLCKGEDLKSCSFWLTWDVAIKTCCVNILPPINCSLVT